jgi:hypothetical protein
MSDLTKPRIRKPFHSQLNEDEEAMLIAISNLHGISKGQVVRTAIRTLYQMSIKHTPLCATGQPCFVPHMHTAVARPLSATVQGEFTNGAL